MQKTPPEPVLAPNKQWENRWDSIWQQRNVVWDVIAWIRSYYNSLAQRLLASRVPDHGSILELGCGTAGVLLSLSPRVGRAVGLDISDAILAQAREAQQARGITNVELVKGDCRAVPYTEQFDVVWSAGLIEHFFKHDIDVVRQHLVAVKPGGIAVMAVPYAYSLHHLHYLISRPAPLRWLWPWSNERHFQQFYSRARLHRLARRIGYPHRVFFLPPPLLGGAIGIVVLQIKKPVVK